MKELLLSVIIACSSVLDGNTSRVQLEKLDNAIMALHTQIQAIQLKSVATSTPAQVLKPVQTYKGDYTSCIVSYDKDGFRSVFC